MKIRREGFLVRKFLMLLLVMLGLVFLGGCGGGTSTMFDDISGVYILRRGVGTAFTIPSERRILGLIEGLMHITTSPRSGAEPNVKPCDILIDTRWRAILPDGTEAPWVFSTGTPATTIRGVEVLKIDGKFVFNIGDHRLEFDRDGGHIDQSGVGQFGPYTVSYSTEDKIEFPDLHGAWRATSGEGTAQGEDGEYKLKLSDPLNVATLRLREIINNDSAKFSSEGGATWEATRADGHKVTMSLWHRVPSDITIKRVSGKKFRYDFSTQESSVEVNLETKEKGTMTETGKYKVNNITYDYSVTYKITR